ncbi:MULTISPECIES: hypothetical protein [Hyphomicrobiales]|jgi:hypothetical protein|uniref:hypothetical protein n=1 Tax=Hyphomicrobiales TaxID=356 RepID=UPI00064815CE|nr:MULTISPECIES: hypothetical protein [Hyphomicrobiales]RKD74109.1 hypothetical protein BJ928_101458 [Rhizobium sp. WW_1]RZS83895.1 hypothetical protein EV217_2646 [Phyllobacterium myrsinacearum]
MTNLLIETASLPTVSPSSYAASTAIRTIEGGVEYRSSGMTDAEADGMTKAMRDQKSLEEFWESLRAQTPRPRSKNLKRRRRSIWPHLFEEAEEELRSLTSPVGRNAFGDYHGRGRKPFLDNACMPFAATAHPALSLNIN